MATDLTPGAQPVPGYRLVERLGRDHLHGNVHRAVEAQLGR